MDLDASHTLKAFYSCTYKYTRSLATPSTPNPFHHRLPINYTTHLWLCHTPYTFCFVSISHQSLFFSAQCLSTIKNPFLDALLLGLIVDLVSNATLSPGHLKTFALAYVRLQGTPSKFIYLNSDLFTSSSTFRLRVLRSGFPYDPFAYFVPFQIRAPLTPIIITFVTSNLFCM